MMSNQTLRARLLTEPMLQYFTRKLSHLAPQLVLIQVEEALKFLMLADECNGAIPVTKEIDEIWHYWILQTREYMDLCELLPTGNYIHHSSNDYGVYFDSTISERTNLELDIKMLALYVKNFGPFERNRIQYWLLANHLLNKCGWSLQELNDWLLGESASRKQSEDDLLESVN